MKVKLTGASARGAYALAALASIAIACGGGGGSSASTGTDSSKVPTATFPATLPEPKIIGAAAFQSGAGAVYVVKSGDSWSAIAARFGVSVDDLLAANSNIDTSQLFPGQSVRLPATDASPTEAPATEPVSTATEAPVTATPQPAATAANTAPAATSSAASPTPGASGQTYTVQSGDIPETIAQKFGITTDALLAANAGLDPTNMHVGDVINIPPKP